jgi:FkbM family methyltransferase
VTRTLTDFFINNRHTARARVSLERFAISSRIARSAANWLFNKVGPSGKTLLYKSRAGLFRDYERSIAPGQWRIESPPFHMSLPLRADWAWLDWNLALATLGHEWEIKDFYAQLLTSPFRPDLFCDIGANYGTHSALFLSAGTPCVAFEPNPDCYQYFQSVLALNKFPEVSWHQIALGDQNCDAILEFPVRDTWLGTIKPINAAKKADTINIAVTVRRLDDLDIPVCSTFCKIDTEGNELAVLRGGVRFFQERCCFFIFESHRGSDRSHLFDFIADLGFHVETLPVIDIQKHNALEKSAFVAAKKKNFLARRLRPQP